MTMTMTTVHRFSPCPCPLSLPARWRLGLSLALGAMASAFAPAALAHVSVVNTQLPYAVAGKSYELVLAVPHGCGYTDAGGSKKDADTTRIEVTVPATFTTPRPIIDGAFGKPTRSVNGDTTTFVWTQPTALASDNDDQSYRIGLRGTVAAGTEFTKLVFNTKQFCKNPSGGAELVQDWANYAGSDGSVSNQSPKVKVYPARTPGWNKFNVAPANEIHTQADVKTFLSDFFSDAQIVWVGKGAYSANATTLARIKAQAAKDGSSFELTEKADAMIHATDDIWVKY